jgi:hypothetical protein
MNPQALPGDPRPPLALRLLLLLTGATLAGHMAVANRYGYFRDELYFLDCGRHLDWGYVDHAPMIGLIARVALILGGSLPAVRLLPALAGTALVALTMLVAWRLGGDRFAQGLAGLAVAVAPVFLAGASLMTMNIIEPLFWMGCVYFLVRLLDAGDSRPWIAFGVVLGLGLMNKHSTVFFGVAVGAGILLTPARRELAKPWIWLGALVALVIFAPNLVWQAAHDFPTLETLRNVARTGKNVVLGPKDFVAQQVLLMHPLLLPLWLAGLAWLFRARGGRYRSLAVAFVFFFVMLFALKAKNYYLAPFYPMLFAAGAVAVSEALGRSHWTTARTWPKAAILAIVLAGGAALAPVVLPILPPERYGDYTAAIGITPPKTEVAQHGALPQHLGDQFGWPEMVAEVARIYRALPPEERAKAAIFANNYGEAGALHMFGPAYGLPNAISAHQNHFYWGPQGATGEVLIVLQDDRASLEAQCASVEQAGEHHHPWGMEEENGPIFVCRGLKTPLPELWPRLKHWN